MLTLSKYSSTFSFLGNRANSESLFNPFFRVPVEWCGMSGLSVKEANNIFSKNQPIRPHWKKESKIRCKLDAFEFKTDILTTIVAAELHIRKARNFTDVINANLILPFTNNVLANYFAKMPEAYLFDRKRLKNKLVLRDMLKNKMDLDSDAIGKMGWSYDSQGVVLQNWDDMMQEIQACILWDQKEVLKLSNRLRATMQSKHKYANLSGRLIYRIYLLSGWANRSKYLNG